MELIDDVFENACVLLLFINSCLYIWSYSKSKKAIALKYFSVYLIITFIITFISIIMAGKGENNLYLSHYYFVFQFIFLSLFYRTLFPKHQKKVVIYILFVILSVLVIQYIFNPNSYYKFNLFEIFITSVPIIIYSIVHLYNSLSKKGEYLFINAGVLIYITTSTLIFILGNYLSAFENNTNTYIWVINKVLYAVYLILILVEWKKLNWQVKNML